MRFFVKNVYLDFCTVPDVKLPTCILAKQVHFLLLAGSFNLTVCKFSCRVILNYSERFTVSIAKTGVDEIEGKHSWYITCPSYSAA